jgi:hypothetical protein
MTTLLQRLVGSVRGAPPATAQRIEPLLAPRFAASRDGTSAPHEVQVEHAAQLPTPIATPSETSAPAISTHDRMINTLPPIHPTRGEHAYDLPANETQHTNTPPPSVETAPPSRVLLEHVRKETLERDVVQPVLSPTVITAPNARMPARTISEPASYSQAVAQQAAAIEEHTQTITISIGRVEVRNAPTPAPAPARRAPFKPGVSLDAFLGRGGSGER